MRSSDDDRNVEFDVFISHAYEDKETFVRPLAQALESRRLRPWYDEFTLRPGDSLRRSIDRGLLTSQAGVVVLSPAFFGKRWTNYELDGLVQLNAGDSGQVAGLGGGSRLLPVWHNVDAQTVANYSPSLANLVALLSDDGVDAVADRILAALRPAGSALLYAHAELAELGEALDWHPPVVTDDWWLDAIEASARTDVEGGFQEPMGWGHWGFPLPEHSTETRQRGHRLARAAAQMMWQIGNEERMISQITPPKEVLDFIESFPGLVDACIENPSYLLSYAPQLAIPGAAGRLQTTVDETYEWARDLVRRDGIDPDSPDGRQRLVRDTGYLALRDVELVRAAPSRAACTWAQGEIHGPPVRVYEPIDYAGWLASDSSSWLESDLRAELLRGIAEWGVWPEWTEDRSARDTERLLELLHEDERSPSRLSRVRAYLVVRLNATAHSLRLGEPGETLADRLLAAQFVELYDRRRREQRRARRAKRQ